MRTSCTVWLLPLTQAVEVVEVMANAPLTVPRPATVRLPLEMATSCTRLRSAKTRSTPPMLVFRVWPRVLMRTWALAAIDTPAKPSRLALPLATSA